jgi:hypothetical protein
VARVVDDVREELNTYKSVMTLTKIILIPKLLVAFSLSIIGDRLIGG